MLHFEFTEEQDQFRKILHDFAKDELLPNYTKWDREGITPRHLWKKLGHLGVTGLRIPEQYGGVGTDCVTTGIAAEEIGRGDFNKEISEYNAGIAEALVKAIPFRRLAQPEDIANAVAFLASNEADYITGQTLSVNGGLAMV